MGRQKLRSCLSWRFFLSPLPGSGGAPCSFPRAYALSYDLSRLRRCAGAEKFGPAIVSACLVCEAPMRNSPQGLKRLSSSPTTARLKSYSDGTFQELLHQLLVLIFACLVCAVAMPAQTASPQQGPPEASRTERRFCKALPGYRWEFPRDHFSHPCFQTEWWYFTGNVSAPGGRRFGFELTFFREGIHNPYPNPSRWRVDDLYLAHFAISDLAPKKFFYTQRFHRAGIELAGADPALGRIWNGDWFAELQGSAWTLAAAEGQQRIRLRMEPIRPPVLQGKNGLSPKAPGEGNASYYYSLTRLETSGELETDGSTYTVSGWSWMDHEFSTSQLQPDQAGWDWVSLQMEDGTDWMLFQLRRADGARDPYSAGSFVSQEGQTRPLLAADFQMLPRTTWRSPHSGADYPIRWRLLVPQLGLDVEISAAMPDQELHTKETAGMIYWEGSILAQGTRNGKPIRGRGYLEMTGYAGSLSGWLYSEVE